MKKTLLKLMRWIGTQIARERIFQMTCSLREDYSEDVPATPKEINEMARLFEIMEFNRAFVQQERLWPNG